MDNWLMAALSTGLQKIYTLSLDRTPGHDTIVGTALTWHESLTHQREWDKARDLPRIEHAFRTLALTSERWPSPRDFLRALPPSDQLQVAGPGPRPHDPEWLRRAMREPLPDGEARISTVSGLNAAAQDVSRST